MHVKIIALEDQLTTLNVELSELQRQINNKQQQKENIMAMQKKANESIADLEASLKRVQDAIAFLGELPRLQATV